MTTLELLQQSAPELGRRVATASPAELRRIAFTMAAVAVKASGLKHDVIDEILRTTEGPGDEALCSTIAEIARDLDERYFELSETAENVGGDREIPPDVTCAFRKARAASALAAALQADPRTAAAEAAYEALAATDDANFLVIAIGELIHRST